MSRWWNETTPDAERAAFWRAVDENNEALLDLVRAWHPTMRYAHHDARPRMPITAAAAEYIRRVQAAEIEGSGPAGEADARWETARAARDVDALSRLANEAWWGIPESSSAHDLEGFGLLCDICSDAPRTDPRPGVAPGDPVELDPHGGDT